MEKSDEDFIEKKRSDHLYVSRPFAIGILKDREARYIARVFDTAERSAFDCVENEIVIRATHDDKVQIKAVVTLDDQNIRQLTLQSFRIYKDGARPNLQYGVNLYGQEIERLVQFALLATQLSGDARGRVKLDAESLAEFDLDETARAWLAKHPAALREIVEQQVTSKDVVALGYRKRQLEKFERLLTDVEHFDQCVDQHASRKKEGVWQDFFECNRWIFGYGLFSMSAGGFSEKQLEQVVSGAAVFTAGKRVDGLLRTLGRVSAACLVEIKHHRTPLLREASYRSGAWQPSSDLSGAVAQVHATVDAAERQFQQLIVGKRTDGSPTGEHAVVARPRSVLVCGSLEEFITADGVNHDRFRSFELYRRQLVAPDVMTFDELFERAKLIVEASETEQ